MKSQIGACLMISVVSMSLLFVQALSAEDAVFSKDGTTIFVAPRSASVPGQLHVISLKTSEVTAIKVPEVQGPIRKVARTKDGIILCMTPVAAYTWNSETGDVERISNAGEASQFLDMICHPVTGVVVFQMERSGREPYSIQSWGARKVPEKTTMTRLAANGIPHATEFRGMAFDPEGSFFFGCDGDLWHGDFRNVQYPNRGDLYSYRYAPLAGRGSFGSGNPSQMGVKSIVAAGSWLYVHHYRIGGTGRGEIIRIAKPERKISTDGTPDYPGSGFEESVGVYKRALGSATVVGKNDDSSPCIAASPDGKLVYFRAEAEGGMAHWLVQDHGAPKRLAIRDKTRDSVK
jgi:hypothetical protein